MSHDAEATCCNAVCSCSHVFFKSSLGRVIYFFKGYLASPSIISNTSGEFSLIHFAAVLNFCVQLCLFIMKHILLFQRRCIQFYLFNIALK